MKRSGNRRTFMALAAGVSALAGSGAAADAGEGELFVFLYSKGAAWKPGVPMEKQALRGHVDYMQRLADARNLFAGGRFMTSDGGMAIVTATSLEDARRMLADDPAVTGGVFVGEVQHWVPRFRTDRPLPARPRG